MCQKSSNLCRDEKRTERIDVEANRADIISSNLCRDEKRTERNIFIEMNLGRRRVATYAAMKSGLKVTKTSFALSTRIL